MIASKFSSKVQESAALVIGKLQQHGGLAFNGLHLRMEDDLAGYVDEEGGFEAMISLYEEAMRQLGYNNSTPLYVASGLFVDETRGLTSTLMNKVWSLLRALDCLDIVCAIAGFECYYGLVI